ncbi:hypothetical protein M422DRAFT_269697 [Sphaerobolus stellatus SS14]|uniref:Uncharacterized protein n=1 Tax=Sphaerobolus stellatus (strain SS14) TaxID=990650 RepID=A0A0C9U462_SPHS4|nr:hypothetical protein M422DRAFT_269697 [Sphaerobolus stellatus SS14]
MPYRPSTMKTDPWYLNWLLPALLAALIIPTIFVFPDPICDSNMLDSVRQRQYGSGLL